MPIPPKYKAPFFCNYFYHLVFKSIDGTLLFRDDLNRTFFLEKFAFFMESVFTCQAWCQLDNHVHFIVCVKDVSIIHQSLSIMPDTDRTVAMNKFLSATENELFVDEIIKRQVNRFMVSYTNTYNKVHKRNGGLFQSPFRRSIIDKDVHLQQAIIYVHANAQKHGLSSDYRTYPYSSFHEIVDEKSLFTDISGVLNFFGGKESFVELHDKQVAYYHANNWPDSKIEV